jgi:hypothetical protein
VLAEATAGVAVPQGGAGAPDTADGGEYVDQLIEGPLPIDEGGVEAAEGWQGLPGRRSLTVGYTGYLRDLDTGGSYREHGLGLNYQQETEQYGNLLLDATLGYADTTNGSFLQAPNTGTGGVVTLYNTGCRWRLWQPTARA